MIKVLLIFGKHAQLIESCIMSLALTLMQLAYFLLAASFRHLLACLGAWISRHGLSWSMVWPVFELHDEQLLLASSGNQFSKSATFKPIALPASR